MIDFSTIKKLTIGEIKLKQLLIDGVQVWKSGYKNLVNTSTESDLKTIYNGGIGYKTGTRVRSGGAETSEPTGICTGFIPYRKGEILRIYPLFSKKNSINTINFYDAELTVLGQYNDDGSLYGTFLQSSSIRTNTDKWTAIDIGSISHARASEVRYVRITHFYDTDATSNTVVNNPEKDFAVTINEEIE